MKLLLFHTNSYASEKKWHLDRARIWSIYGHQTEVVTLPEFIKFDYYRRLNSRFIKKELELLAFYDKLFEKILGVDVFIHFGGGMLHPEFVCRIPERVVKIYHCADDPESSDILSRPVAKYYDYCAVSNIAEIDAYKKWGIKNVFFWPLGAMKYNEDTNSEIDSIDFNSRKISLGFLGSKYGTSQLGTFGRLLGLYNKKGDMKKLLKVFPDLVGYGKGWGNGFLDGDFVPGFYKNLKFGINIHNSTGPINSRTYDLNAYGVCQLCDNKNQLAKIYELDKEVIGYDSIEEAISKLIYLLNHIDEAQEIAYNGRVRFLNCYTSISILRILLKEIGIKQ